MAFTTLLEIVNQSLGELGLGTVTAVAGVTSGLSQQMFYLANACGRRLVREHMWGDLITLGTITTVDGTSTYALPSDYDRMVSETQWNRTQKWQLSGPITPQEDRALREGITILPTAWARFRQIGNTSVEITPTPAVNGDVLAYEYISNKWAASSGGTAAAAFAADTDTTIYDPDLMVLCLKWRFLAAKGMGSAADAMAEYNMELQKAKAADIGGYTLNMEGHGIAAGDVSASSTVGNTQFTVWE